MRNGLQMIKKLFKLLKRETKIRKELTKFIGFEKFLQYRKYKVGIEINAFC